MRTIFILQEAGFFIRLPDPQREARMPPDFEETGLLRAHRKVCVEANLF
jgi:hypothetical protein